MVEAVGPLMKNSLSGGLLASMPGERHSVATSRAGKE
jgi:hypothetical protein